MNNYKYILFDWDGCLAKTLEAWLTSYRETLQLFDKTASDSEIASHFGDWKIGTHLGVTDSDRFNKESVSTAERLLENVALYDGAIDLLQNLHGNKKLALVSSGSRHIVLAGLRRNGIENIFDCIITGDDPIEHKPSPAPLLKALELLGGTIEEAVMIGDSSKDLGAANNCGMDSILMFHPSHALFYDLKKLQSFKPTHTFEHFKDLNQALF